MRAAPGPGQGALRRGDLEPGQLAQSDEGVADGGQGEDVRGGRRVARQPAGGGGSGTEAGGRRWVAANCTAMHEQPESRFGDPNGKPLSCE